MITVGFAHDEMTVTNYTEALTIAQNGANVTWSVSSYENVTWTVDDAEPVSGNSFTLIPANYAVKKHRAVVSGTKNGKPYSKILEFTITEAGEEPPEEEPETFTVGTLAEYLTAKAANTAANPYIIKFDSTCNTANNSFSYKIAPILKNNNTKYVAFDMSDLIFTDNAITGSASNTSNDFNYLNSCTNLVGIILPNNLAKLTAAFYGMASLQWVVIPATVTSIHVDTFKKCPAITKITIYNASRIGTTSSTTWNAYVSPGKTNAATVTGEGSFYALYQSQTDFSGVYTYTDESWSKSALPE